jgi:uncharacterized membrane protein YhhN
MIRSRIRWAFVASAATTAIAGALHVRPVVGVFKPLTMGLLAVDVLSKDVLHRHTARPRVDDVLLGAAVGTAMAGDYFMYRDEFEPESTENYDATVDLRTGASMFALTQLSYIGLLARLGARPTPTGWLTRVAAMGESGALVLANQPKLLPALGTYGNLLATMAAFAGSPALGDRPERRRILAGSLLFMLSDSLIMNRRYLLQDNELRGPVEGAVLGTYFAAQALLLGGIADASRHPIKADGPIAG